MKNKKENVSIEEIREAYLNSELKEFQEEHHISEFAVKKRLKEEYGNYAELFREEKAQRTKIKKYQFSDEEDSRGKRLKEFVRLHEEGVSNIQIAKMLNVSRNVVQMELNRYYEIIENREVPRIISRAMFEKSLKENGSLEKVIMYADGCNFIIPKQYIHECMKREEEKNTIDGVNIKKIRENVMNELLQSGIMKENKSYLKAFNLARVIKQKGYEPKYQAAALIYSLVKNSLLEYDEKIKIDNDETDEAIRTLIDSTNLKGKKLEEALQNNEVARTIRKEEIEWMREILENNWEIEF